MEIGYTSLSSWLDAAVTGFHDFFSIRARVLVPEMYELSNIRFFRIGLEISALILPRIRRVTFALDDCKSRGDQVLPGTLVVARTGHGGQMMSFDGTIVLGVSTLQREKDASVRMMVD